MFASVWDGVAERFSTLGVDSESLIGAVVFVSLVLSTLVVVPMWVTSVLLLLLLALVWLDERYSLVLLSPSVSSGSSMRPAIPSGASAYLAVYPLRLSVGDIIVFEREDHRIHHRIVSIDGDRIITQGDNNAAPDDPIQRSQVVSKTLAIRGQPLVLPLTPTAMQDSLRILRARITELVTGPEETLYSRAPLLADLEYEPTPAEIHDFEPIETGESRRVCQSHVFVNAYYEARRFHEWGVSRATLVSALEAIAAFTVAPESQPYRDRLGRLEDSGQFSAFMERVVGERRTFEEAFAFLVLQALCASETALTPTEVHDTLLLAAQHFEEYTQK
jgi:signal peptidase I